MEIELKYNIPDIETANEIWRNKLFADLEEPGSREELRLDAQYFDTETYDLANNEIAYRVRREDDRLVAALKWKGHCEDGLHVREEINVPVDSEAPNPGVFRESRIGSAVMGFVEDKKLVCVLETVYERRIFRIDTGKGIYEFSIDVGEIVTEHGTIPILEVEIELFSGETDELREIGRKLLHRYGLTEENESKYSRGMKLIREGEQAEVR